MTNIYALIDPSTQFVRYIGKTIKPLPQRLKEHLRDGDDNRKSRWIGKLLAASIAPLIVLLESVDDQNWQSAEKRWIAHFRNMGHDLTNLTSGGDGVQNMSSETRAKLSRLTQKRMSNVEYKKRIFTAERSAKISTALRNKPKSTAHVAKLPQNQKGFRHSDAFKQKISRSLMGNHRNPNIRQWGLMNVGNKYGLGNKSRTGQTQGPEERHKKSIALRGIKRSDATRYKMTIAALNRWHSKGQTNEKNNATR